MKTDTPETDAETMDGAYKEQGCTITLHQWDYYKATDGEVVMVEFARRLERERDEARKQHAADVAELNARLTKQQSDMLGTIVELRQALSGRTVSCSQCNESARTIEAMREAIKEAHAAIGGCLKYILRLPLSGSDAECETMDDAHHALRKLKPFLK